MEAISILLHSMPCEKGTSSLDFKPVHPFHVPAVLEMVSNHSLYLFYMLLVML